MNTMRKRRRKKRKIIKEDRDWWGNKKNTKTKKDSVICGDLSCFSLSCQPWKQKFTFKFVFNLKLQGWWWWRFQLLWRNFHQLKWVYKFAFFRIKNFFLILQLNLFFSLIMIYPLSHLPSSTIQLQFSHHRAKKKQ